MTVAHMGTKGLCEFFGNGVVLLRRNVTGSRRKNIYHPDAGVRTMLIGGECDARVRFASRKQNDCEWADGSVSGNDAILAWVPTFGARCEADRLFQDLLSAVA